MSGAELIFYHGPMGAGKSTFALQTHFNQGQQGRTGLLLTTLDRSGEAEVTSRIGLSADAVALGPGEDLRATVLGHHERQELDYLVCDEAQFLTPTQVDQLARIVDDAGIDAFTFGLLTDFRSVLFPGSARLVEIADEVHRMQAIVLCWCGRPGFLNARIVDGRVARTGAVIAVGDTHDGPVVYRALCRRHYVKGRAAR
ncbi:thymidine kinase [Gordonia sp. LSe1-13]|uniref:Thymidine kinase n=1 Tax=Gordonia sesuvii TaxID=3116777 RepID=A0ABU7MCP8_9ACTN|nr:thymidine kinase [Gordonia sp. LSe1-13]